MVFTKNDNTLFGLCARWVARKALPSPSVDTYAKILLPLALTQPYTYRVPDRLAGALQVGCRVLVPLGVRKRYAGLVVGLTDEAPAAHLKVRDIIDVLDSRPVLFDEQVKFWQWIAFYYMCTMGEVMKTALPAGLKLEGEVRIRKNPGFIDESDLTSDEQRLLNLLPDRKAMRLSDFPEIGGITTVFPLVKSLMERRAIEVEEHLTRAFRPAIMRCVRLSASLCAPEALTATLNILKRAPKQQSLLLSYVGMADAMTAVAAHNPAALKEVEVARLLDETDSSHTILKALAGCGVLEVYTVEKSRLGFDAQQPTVGLPDLSPAQQQALDELHHALADRDICLLHGITSSGKTEVYQRLIDETLARGEQVLFLVPEIALTTQLMQRLAKVFGGRLGVYHSGFPDSERVELWRRQCSDNPYPLILGARSALFLPFRKLGLIVVDEEHDASYKQQEPAPRYVARDAALVLARLSGAKVVLGSATPSVESYHHARSGKYGLVELRERYGGKALPKIVVEDVADLKYRRMMPSVFSPRLLDELKQALHNGEQAILFQNRRGYAPTLQCNRCGWTPHCERCDVPLTVHQHNGLLLCHYCGATYQMPVACPKCGHTELRDRGFGTEKVEEAVVNSFAEARVARMDLDTTRKRTAYDEIIRQFSAGEKNVLIGTQMVTKGLDFDKVRVVGILSADQAINAPDFRAYERAFQLMTQVAGRAGRKGEQGLVVLQTHQAKLPLIRQIVENDYAGMYEEQIAEREQYVYPPYCRLIVVYVRHSREDLCVGASNWLAELLRPHFGTQLLGPDRPLVGRVHSLYIRKILLKVLPQQQTAAVRQVLWMARKALSGHALYKRVDVFFDVDPQ